MQENRTQVEEAIAGGDLLDVAQIAIGLGGWKVDPADPWKAPYSPENAALAAAALIGYRFEPGDRVLVELAVERAFDADDRDPEDYR
jgi:hypothetical protein